MCPVFVVRYIVLFTWRTHLENNDLYTQVRRYFGSQLLVQSVHWCQPSFSFPYEVEFSQGLFQLTPPVDSLFTGVNTRSHPTHLVPVVKEILHVTSIKLPFPRGLHELDNNNKIVTLRSGRTGPSRSMSHTYDGQCTPEMIDFLESQPMSNKEQYITRLCNIDFKPCSLFQRFTSTSGHFLFQRFAAYFNDHPDEFYVTHLWRGGLSERGQFSVLPDGPVSMADPVQPQIVLQVPVAGAQQLAPGQATLVILLSPWDGDIDLSTKTGKSLWDEGIKPLETKFSGNGPDLPRFLADVSN
ncbi:hypothetical protein G9A89_000488, partial [Geosiphon pyriformis]